MNRVHPREAITALLLLALAGFAQTQAATWLVDDDAPSDPGPGDPNVSDPLEDGSRRHPFDRVQEGIDAASEGDIVQVMEGTYPESLTVRRAGLVISGSGSGLTLVTPISGPALDARLEVGSSPLSLALSMTDLSLAGGDVVIDILVTLLTLPAPDVVLDRIEVSHGDLALRGNRGQFLVRGARVEEGDISLVALDSGIGGALLHVDAPGSTLRLGGTAGGSLVAAVESSRLSAVVIGERVSVEARGVRFTGAGILAEGPPGCHRVIDAERSVFESGGIRIGQTPDSFLVCSTTGLIEVQGCEFHGAGISASVRTGITDVLPDRFSLVVDANRFRAQGISIHVSRQGTDILSPDIVSAHVTNNIFESVPVGLDVVYDMQTGPPLVPMDFRLAAANNTFFGSLTGIHLRSTTTYPGVERLTTILQNNIVAGGRTGVLVEGTGDLDLSMIGNDVTGNTTGDYLGDIADPTGLDGNISADPVFLDAAARNFRLSPASPCIDAARSGPDVPARDFSGTLRPLDGDGDGVALPDIGAYEEGDADGDGYPAGIDCGDSDPAIHPGAVDVPGNPIDEDCSGSPTCDPSVPWRNHGGFVSCVQQACDALVVSGVVSRDQCEALVSEAARSDTGG